jgi:hypothetical protein
MQLQRKMIITLSSSFLSNLISVTVRSSGVSDAMLIENHKITLIMHKFLVSLFLNPTLIVRAQFPAKLFYPEQVQFVSTPQINSLTETMILKRMFKEIRSFL